jgi:anti-anti-sigma factor
MADSREMLFIEVEHDRHRTVIRLGGELDLATAPELDQLLNDTSGEIIVDLDELEFMDAQGLTVLSAADRRARQHGDRVIVVHASPLVQRMFRITGLEHLLSGSDAL